MYELNLVFSLFSFPISCPSPFLLLHLSRMFVSFFTSLFYFICVLLFLYISRRRKHDRLKKSKKEICRRESKQGKHCSNIALRSVENVRAEKRKIGEEERKGVGE